MDRRTTIKWVLAASAAWPLTRADAVHAAAVPAQHAATNTGTATGYGTDPDLSKLHLAGELWPLILTADQRLLAGKLSDIIIPADDHSPGASAAGVVDFIDEWVSAPYPDCQRDRAIILPGLNWLDLEAQRLDGRSFVDLMPMAQAALCDDICDAARAPAALRDAATFFARYRDLTAGAFYSSPAGRLDLNYIGNVPQVSFAGPPLALLKSLGLA